MTNEQVKDIFSFVFGSRRTNRLTSIIPEDHEKARMFAEELTQRSCQMGWVEALFRSTANPNMSIKNIIIPMATQIYHGCSEDVEEGRIYNSVRNTLRWNWTSAFEIRIQTGNW